MQGHYIFANLTITQLLLQERSFHSDERAFIYAIRMVINAINQASEEVLKNRQKQAG